MTEPLTATNQLNFTAHIHWATRTYTTSSMHAAWRVHILHWHSHKYMKVVLAYKWYMHYG